MESSIKALSKYRFETSKEAISDAELMFENGRYKNALNRAYYAIFHAMRAVNASKEEAEKQIQRAKIFQQVIENYLAERGI